MATFTPIRGTRAEIQATPMVDGQFLMETDQQDRSRIYMDTADGGTLERITVGRGTAQDLGDLDDVTLEAPIENLSYLRYDSNSEEWIKDTTMVKSTNSDSEIWVQNKNYYVNNPVTNETDYVIDDNKLWVCIADNTSTDTNRPSHVGQTCWENVSLISLRSSFTKRTSGNWEYMIFPNGFKIMTYRADVTIPRWVAWGNVYESNRLLEGITYPVQFENTPNYAITMAMNTIGFECTSRSTATFNGFNAVRPNDTVAPGSYFCQVTFWGF